jgi:hypothetical protein
VNKPDGLPLNKIVLYLDGKCLTLHKADPANSDELNELKELDKQGLTKVLVVDTSASFIADKRAIDRLICNLSDSDKAITELVDRSQQGQSSVQIYASNISLRKYALTPDQYQKLVCEEDLILEDYNKQE